MPNWSHHKNEIAQIVADNNSNRARVRKIGFDMLVVDLVPIICIASSFAASFEFGLDMISRLLLMVRIMYSME